MIDLGTAYQDSRRRLTALVAALPDDGGDRDPRSVDVACCPGWTVHDVVAHLASVADDVLEGRLTGPPNDEETAAQVARWAGVPTGRVLDEWADRSPALEKLLSEVPVWPALMDVLSHEHDVRQALGEPGARDLPEIQTCAYVSLKWMLTSVDMGVTLDGRVMRPEGAEEDDQLLGLDTTAWEAFRFRLGRRSRAQLQAMAWTGDPGPVLDRITVFGPSPRDITE
ncbi:MAG TPA: maleylpyruvate isomerase N-terminal domain-containing protein [Acidimicrobiales bacterium]|nr:maleylpyruvate isomerase N-terminal domain-containing protein [Acidimicrobiales bacterium]